MEQSDSKLVKGLVLWYGLFQFVHIFVNVRGLWLLSQGGIDFPALPPPEGWTEQVLHFFTAVAGLDLLNTLLTLLFVYGFFRQARWRWWLGTLTLTVSLYAACFLTTRRLPSARGLEPICPPISLSTSLSCRCSGSLC